MGSPAGEEGRDGDETQHEVVLSRGFLLGEAPVTQAEYAAVVGSNPSHFSGNPDHPVECVSWFMAVSFCNALSRRVGFDLRLVDLAASDAAATVRALSPALTWVETPSNPLLAISDLAALAEGRAARVSWRDTRAGLTIAAKPGLSAMAASTAPPTTIFRRASSFRAATFASLSASAIRRSSWALRLRKLSRRAAVFA